MPESARLSNAIDEYLESLAARGQAASTLKCKKSTLLRFLASTGNIYVKNIGVHHVDAWLVAQSSKWSPATRRLNIDYLSSFQDWLIARRYYPRGEDFLEGMRKLKVPKKRRPRVEVDDFEALLDAAPCGRDRIMVALGLHLLVRMSEMTPIQWKHVVTKPTGTYIQIYRRKTGTHDDLPVSGDLEVELDRWRREVCKAKGVTTPDPEWFIVCRMYRPAVRDARGWYTSEKGTGRLSPEEMLKDPGLRVKKILAAVGITERGARMHVLRRSGAVALRDVLMDSEGEGRDRALTTAQFMMGHASRSTSELYMDDNYDKSVRDQLIQGKFLYQRRNASEDAKVVPLKRESG